MSKLDFKPKGYEFEVPVKKKNGTYSKRIIKMRIHTVFEFKNEIEYYLEKLVGKEWVFIHKLVKHETIKKYLNGTIKNKS